MCKYRWYLSYSFETDVLLSLKYLILFVLPKQKLWALNVHQYVYQGYSVSTLLHLSDQQVFFCMGYNHTKHAIALQKQCFENALIYTNVDTH